MTQSIVAASPVAAQERPTQEMIDAAVTHVTRKIAPLWPLKHFVAVNPFLGLADIPFAEAARLMAQTAGARMTMPRAFYAEAIQNGRITEQHIAEAHEQVRDQLGRAAAPAHAAEVRELALAKDADTAGVLVPSVTDVVGRITGQDWPRFATDRRSHWAAGYFDEGQASWPSPWHGLPAFTAWRAEASLDRTPEVMGARGFRAAVKRLPADCADALPATIEHLGVPAAFLEPYLHRLLMGMGGWAAYARYQRWQSELYDRTDDTLIQALAVSLGWEVALLESFAAKGAREAWASAIQAWDASAKSQSFDAALAVDLVLQHAYEIGWQQQLVAKLGARTGVPSSPAPGREAPRLTAQAAFCIDIRSEVFRRALESVDDTIETIGFAGFFGFPIEYVPLGLDHGGAQCPVLLTPKLVVTETVLGASTSDAAKRGADRLLRRRARNAWKAFKQSAISCFSFVGPVGLTYAPKLVTDSLGLTRPVEHPRNDGLTKQVRMIIGPTLEPGTVAGRATGLAPSDRLEMAESVLKAMSLTGTFARLVLLAGHGSTTVNNPHATGLDCGACGGHTGEANARVAAAVLNDPFVRSGLRDRGIHVPDDTVFLAGVHDTTTDEVTVFDDASLPATDRAELARFKKQLAQAARLARSERAPSLKVAVNSSTDANVIARSRDWSQVRPEWGLAGCAAFIAAPRSRTKGLNFGGRSFLHSYEWRQDKQFGTLELIMTAPIVVASWISLQYYGSTVDNRVFGSGNKTLHNVVGTLGVLEGNGGDLRTGLPWQSVHDGSRHVHEPLRLNVVVEAPIDAMNAIISNHELVRQLLDHGWIHLWAMGETGAVTHRFVGGNEWSPVSADLDCQ